jgi:hypothetical protein
MPANNSKNSKAPVKAEPVAAAPTPQKGGKATKADSAPKVVEAAPVVEVKQKGGKAAAAKEVAPAKAVVEAKAAPVQKAGAKKAAPAKEVAAVPEAKKGGAKKAAAPKAEKAPKVAKKEVAEEDGEDDAKGVRSFKVQLPGNEDYTGRFTGLTPYQAANKALSKYFRENKNAKTEITFSIRESTRGSKRSTYTYNGKREKLSTPVKYSIKSADGVAREIVKEYKNKLTKVKKSETKEASA